MSEPVSNVEIEDVLSSIRRLVSNDVEATQSATVTEAVAAEPIAKAPAGKLILTADFRVSEPRDDQPEAAAEAGDEDVVAKHDRVEETAQPEPVEAAVDAPFEFHHTEPFSEVDDKAAGEPEPTFEAADEQQQARAEVWHDPAALVLDAVSSDAPSSPFEETIAELEATIGQQDGEWEPDGSDFEEDADAEEVMSEPVQDWIDGSAEDLDATAEVAEAEAEDPDLFGARESVIDEETLRDMVSDIVRQELQGALGERITRNVRKLVRREINRVLAAQDFE